MALGLATREAGTGETLLNRFAGDVGAKTYGQLYGSWWPGSMEALESNLETAMQSSSRLHFNLEGMSAARYSEFAKNPAFSSGNITNWELHKIMSNPSLLQKTKFYGLPSFF
jgi:hypothetical protein